MTKLKFRYIDSEFMKKSNIQYRTNRICNQKYRWYTLFFWVFAQQFEFFFNTYFFFIAVTQIFEKFAITSPVSSIAPWVLVLMISLLKEGYDDYKRFERDKALNNQSYIRYEKGKFVRIKSSDIRVGDIILLQKNERVPADMVLLKTADYSGQLFVRTDQLDGETDWKARSTLPFIHNGDMGLLEHVKVIAESPHKDIYTFNGSITTESFGEEFFSNIEFEDGQSKGFFSDKGFFSGKGFFSDRFKSRQVDENSQTEQVELDVYDWVYRKNQEDEKETGLGVILNDSDIPGHEIKNLETEEAKPEEMLENKTVEDNAETLKTVPIEKITETKLGVHGLSLDNMLWMNTSIATSSALGFVVYTGDDARAMMNTSKPRNKIGIFDEEINNYSKFLGITSALIAGIFTWLKGETEERLLVFVKFIVLFSSIIPISLKITIDMGRYAYAYDISNNENIKGTVVRNSNVPEELGRISYFLSDKTGTLTKNEMEMKKVHIGAALLSEDNFDELKQSMAKFLEKKKDDKQMFSRNKRDIYTKSYEAVEALSVCHNVTPVVSDNGATSYQASSPDEVAIVQWTESVGMKLVNRTKTLITIENILNERVDYEILYIFPFTSETKRMGIIVRQNNTISFILKGADAVMNKIIIKNEWCEEEVENMARDGLRTLIIAKRILTDNEFQDFDRIYTEAKASLENRYERIEEAMKFIEKDLYAVGLTGVEDKLQDNVKVTLETLRNAGIKVWMLTGDKIETAISIAVSSRILTKDSFYIILDNLKDLDVLDSKLKEIERSHFNSIIVDGTSMGLIMEYRFDEFIKFASEMDVIVGCRFSPTQKALCARHLKNLTKKIVCCIGDGGNDVSMITEANVGIGIVGKEGNQASLAADYSILRFCDVTELILWHGRNSYKNSSILAYLIIHRGTILSVLQGLFCSFIRFIPFNLYNGIILIAFVSLYTFFPIFSAVYTSDVTRETARKFPEIYKELLENKLLSIKEFASWNMMSFYQGTVIMILTLMSKQELFAISTITFTSLIINEISMVFLTVSRINKYVVTACVLSSLIYMFSFIFFRQSFYLDQPFYIFIPKVLGINLVAISLMLIKIAFEYYRPSTSSKLESSAV
ncbi:putative phospholipid-transporting ATPase IIB [Nosema granulosis]|uniref:Phospholipid-transporting ATPase n=1 Tax=Nosema granulosis TaxID=83296 RepID=A0A9P6KYW4_9MICR|nr:putative phospholipid-transporting ATPase IIB [Nosema granulosis]